MSRFWPFIFLFGSGLAALSYQMIWMREFRLVFGASTASTAAVSALFMAGMGLGGWLLGPKADRHKRPLLLYGQLELAISILAALSPLLLFATRAVYLQSGGLLVLGLFGGTVARLALATAVIGLPAFLMGGTLPAAARAVTLESDKSRLSLGALYGVNTIGALTGVLLTTFLALEALGARSTLYLAVALNLSVALLAIKAAQRGPGTVPPPAAAGPLPGGEAGSAGLPASLSLMAAAVAGFSFFLMELVWYRMMAPVLGGSIYTFGLTLAAALAGIGLGGALHPLIFRNRRPNVWHLAATCLLEALAIMFPYALGDTIPMMAAQTRPLSALGFSGLVGSWALITLLVVFPASIISGVQFPLLISLLGRGRENLGRQTGLTYACNTGGAILGSLAGGFGLLPWLSAPGCWLMCGGLMALLGLALAVQAWMKTRADSLFGLKRGPVFAFLALTLALTVLCFTAEGPSAAWRHAPTGAGRVNLTNSLNDLRKQNRHYRAATMWEADGVESSVGIFNNDGYAFVVNGKVDGNVIGDRGTQIMSGLLGAAIHPHPRSALVVGLGTGCTAGWISAVPGLDRVDVVELEPAIIHMARLSAPANHDVVAKAEAGRGVRILINDAREVLNTIPEKYDLIVSEPSNPYRAGIASLYTREFYQGVADRLEEGGLFVKWCQAYEVEGQTAFTIMATLKSVFPHVECWSTQWGGDLMFVSSKRPINPEPEALAARLNSSPYLEAMRITWGTEGLESFLAHYVANDDFVNLAAQTVHPFDINTDDKMLVEYAYADTVGQKTNFSVAMLHQAALARGLSSPKWLPDGFDRETMYLNMAIANLANFDYSWAAPELSPDLRKRVGALHGWSRGNFAALPDYWPSSPGPSLSSFEALALAESLAWRGDERALPLLENHGWKWPASSAVIKAVLAYKQQRPQEALAELERACAFLRQSPWEMRAVIERGLDMARNLAREGEAKDAYRLCDALGEPFSVAAYELRRKHALFAISGSAGVEKEKEMLLRWFEPNPPWTESFLSRRVHVYAATGHPNLKKARRDLELFYKKLDPSVEDMLQRAPIETARPRL